MKNKNSILQTEDLTIGFKGRDGSDGIIFENINVSAGKAELVALFGPNGIGKSTLLRNLVRLQLPVSGEIFLFNQSIRSFSRTRLARKLGYVSTETIYINNLRVYDLVSLGRYPYTGLMGRLDREDHEKVNDAINMVSIQHLRNKFIHQLSDGERQRAMIARTLAQDTDIIILDEPTAFLDLPNKYEVVHLLRNLAREREKTIIFSTHDLNIAIQEAGKIWLMLEDTIIQGAPEDLILDGSFGKMFVNTSLSFNKSMGEFRIARVPGRKIGLKGPKTECKWTTNALERMGFEVSREPGQDIMINITRDGDKRIWELAMHNRKYLLSGIYELCSWISEKIYLSGKNGSPG